MKLTPRQREVLELLNKGGELVCYQPGGWWLNDEHGDDAGKLGGKTAQFFIRNVLISSDLMPGDSCHYFNINEDGQKVLEDPNYEPRINKHLSDHDRLIQKAFRF